MANMDKKWNKYNKTNYIRASRCKPRILNYLLYISLYNMNSEVICSNIRVTTHVKLAFPLSYEDEAQ